LLEGVDLVLRIGFVPHGDQIITALADVLAVEDRAGEYTRGVKRHMDVSLRVFGEAVSC
jgi:hypothetical protein